MRWVELAPEFPKRVEAAIYRGKVNKAVRSDVLYVEMFKFAPLGCAEILAEMWRTIGRRRSAHSNGLEESPVHCSTNGYYSALENYRPLCFICHARKVVDMAVLSEVNESFPTKKAQSGFEAHISTIQAIITVYDCKERRLHHIALLNRGKAYDRVDRRLRVQIGTRWFSLTLVNIDRCLIVPMRVST